MQALLVLSCWRRSCSYWPLIQGFGNILSFPIVSGTLWELVSASNACWHLYKLKSFLTLLRAFSLVCNAEGFPAAAICTGPWIRQLRAVRSQRRTGNRTETVIAAIASLRPPKCHMKAPKCLRCSEIKHSEKRVQGRSRGNLAVQAPETIGKCDER